MEKKEIGVKKVLEQYLPKQLHLLEDRFENSPSDRPKGSMLPSMKSWYIPSTAVEAEAYVYAIIDMNSETLNAYIGSRLGSHGESNRKIGVSYIATPSNEEFCDRLNNNFDAWQENFRYVILATGDHDAMRMLEMKLVNYYMDNYTDQTYNKAKIPWIKNTKGDLTRSQVKEIGEVVRGLKKEYVERYSKYYDDAERGEVDGPFCDEWFYDCLPSWAFDVNGEPLVTLEWNSVDELRSHKSFQIRTTGVVSENVDEITGKMVDTDIREYEPSISWENNGVWWRWSGNNGFSAAEDYVKSKPGNRPASTTFLPWIKIHRDLADQWTPQDKKALAFTQNPARKVGEQMDTKSWAQQIYEQWLSDRGWSVEDITEQRISDTLGFGRSKLDGWNSKSDNPMFDLEYSSAAAGKAMEEARKLARKEMNGQKYSGVLFTWKKGKTDSVNTQSESGNRVLGKIMERFELRYDNNISSMISTGKFDLDGRIEKIQAENGTFTDKDWVLNKSPKSTYILYVYTNSINSYEDYYIGPVEKGGRTWDNEMDYHKVRLLKQIVKGGYGIEEVVVVQLPLWLHEVESDSSEIDVTVTSITKQGVGDTSTLSVDVQDVQNHQNVKDEA